MTIKDDLHALVDELDEQDAREAMAYLRALRDLPSRPSPAFVEDTQRALDEALESDAVHLPFVVPSNASGNATVEILDSGGRTVRRITLSNPSPGVQEVVWDGTNDSGRATAPGVYRGWLIAGGTRTGTRLLRVP